MDEIGFRDLLDRIADGLVAWDAEWRYTFVNASAGVMLGHRPEDLVGRSYHEVFPEAAGTPFERAYARAMRDQVPLVIEDYYAPWDRWFENRICPRDGGLVILFIEITERKRAVAEIARARDRLDLLHALDRAILAQQPLSVVAQEALAGLAGLLPIDAASIVRVDPVTGAAGMVAASGWLAATMPGPATSALCAYGETASVDLDDDTDGVGDALREALRAHDAVAFRRLALRSPTGMLVGALNLVTSSVGAFSSDALGAATEVAAQLEIAIHQGMLADQVSRHAERLAGLHEMDLAILRAASMGDVADVAARHLHSLLRVDRVTVALVDIPRVALNVVGVAGVDPPPDLPTTIPLPPGVDPTALTDPMVHLHPDLVAAAATEAGARGLAAQGFISAAHVPMVLDERVVGHLGIHVRTRREFTTDEVEMMADVGRRLAIAILGLGHREELERRATRLAGLHAMDLAILGAHDPAAVARIGLEHLGRLVPGQRGSVVLFDIADTAHVLAIDGVTAPLEPATPLTLPLDAYDPLPGRLAESAGPVTIDLEADVLGERLLEIRDLGIRRMLATPLRAGGELYGSLNIGSSDPDAFDDHMRQVVGEVAAQLAIALRQARYRDELAKRARRLELLRDLDQTILDAADTQDVLLAAGHHVRDLSGADLVFVAEYDVAAGTGVARLVDGVVPGAVRTGERYPLTRVLSPAFVADPTPFDVPDLAATAHALPFMARLAENGIRSLVFRPLIASGQLVGSLGLGWLHPGAVADTTREIASEVADSLAVAVRQARLRGALAAREAHLSTILEASANLILTVNPAGRITFANPAAGRAFGTDGALVGMLIDDLVRDADRDGHRIGIARYFELGGTDDVAPRQGVAARRLDGTTFPVTIDLAPIETSAGREVVVTMVDLSERVEMERRLAQAQRMETLGEFAGILAHDVRNYINAIGWAAGALSADLAPDDPGRTDVTLIQRAVDEARDMVASVLEFARPGPRTGQTDISTHIARVGGILARLMGPATDLVTDVPDGLPAVAIAPAALTQVLVNLATNARDAMPEGGSLRISARRHRVTAVAREAVLPPGPYVRVVVSDTGAGMDAATARRAFEAYFTTKDETDRAEGVGLGLASAYLMVARAGGRIEIRSRRGTGTTFRIDLPVAPPDDAAG